ncbi:carbohydrate ABC transporter membrane protein 2 (CUT1 family) [Motilibacter rhizosphaerae]|uniref:Carbohydrate ABC transporter membrane protein 2 (CUT1 family) n=1 Tax=Motilibacter rhizosphaerae TaxID=598652 RepID=A0A4V2F505_9ACTN|nr:carbohydrate ABC transporter permease [Motilibacter rhizosphaerae]RZS91139.1 carbohydrate ABC transporter membrane protein 2 (CUT1 family) [Motilibacter rhizosphaerae]
MRNARPALVGGAAIVVSAVFFLVPFAFIFLTASMNTVQSGDLSFALPHGFHLIDNLKSVVQARDYMILTAFVDSIVVTVVSVTALVILGAMVAFVLQRRASRLNPAINLLVLAGLIVPPAVVPTIWVLQKAHVFKTLEGLMLIEIAYGLPFCVLLFRAFIATIPRELDEAAMIDGAGPLRIFFQIIFPVLRSVIVTVVVLQTVFIYNDFQNPLYFLPGDDHPTVQLTLFNFQSQFTTQYNLLFADILLVTIPPLILFVFLNRKIVEGMAAGAVKG